MGFWREVLVCFFHFLAAEDFGMHLKRVLGTSMQQIHRDPQMRSAAECLSIELFGSLSPSSGFSERVGWRKFQQGIN